MQRIFEMFTIVKKKVIHYGSKFSYFGSRRDPHKRLPQLGFYPVYILNNSTLLENALVFISHGEEDMLCKIVRSQNSFQWFPKKFGALEFVSENSRHPQPISFQT